MMYTIIISESARLDLRNIFEYIANQLQVPRAAKDITRLILSKIDGLKSMPTLYKIYPQEPLRSKNIRYIPVKKYIVFYKVIDEIKTVVISRIMYGGQDIRNQF
ncbi:MAG: type II toxin-antitoxin system RelE/ParE family toxin [Spirochaetales bacterium]